MAETQLVDQLPVGGQVVALEIIQEPATGAHHLEKATPAMMLTGLSTNLIIACSVAR